MSVIIPFFILTNMIFASVVSQVVGQSGDSVVTSREVQINYFIETILFHDGDKNQSPQIQLNSSQFEKETTRVLIEWVVSFEAEAFKAVPIPGADVEESSQLIQKSVVQGGHQNYWSSLQVTDSELKEIIERKLRAKKFIQFKTRGSMVPVTDAEALQYFQKNKGRFGNAPFSKFKDSIKNLLTQDQANTRLRTWFELLQKKYKVRRVALKDQ